MSLKFTSFPDVEPRYQLFKMTAENMTIRELFQELRGQMREATPAELEALAQRRCTNERVQWMLIVSDELDFWLQEEE
jgi:hypothetical protein